MKEITKIKTLMGEGFILQGIDRKNPYFCFEIGSRYVRKSKVRVNIFNGEVLVFTRRYDRKKGSWRRYKNIFSAFRAMTHILMSYYWVNNLKLGEIKELESIAEEVKNKHSVLDDKRATPEQREEIREEILKLALYFKGKINTYKERAGQRIKRGAEEKDSLGRINPNAELASLVGAINDINRRIKEIKGIIPHIQKRKRKLEEVINQLARIFNQCSSWVDRDIKKQGEINKQTAYAILNTLINDFCAEPYRSSVIRIKSLILDWINLDKQENSKNITKLKVVTSQTIQKEFLEV
ncbi:hypothetical protein ACFLZS_02050, partial [Patescibacteria group bacterium]